MQKKSILNLGTSSNKDSVPLWLITFADSMSLMLTFFVLLFSFSDPIVNQVIDESKLVQSKKDNKKKTEKREPVESKINYGGKTGADMNGAHSEGEGDLSKKTDPVEEKDYAVLLKSDMFETKAQDLYADVSPDDIGDYFQENIAELDRIADVSVDIQNKQINIFFTLKDIFEQESVVIKNENLRILNELAQILVFLHNDIIVESYFVPPQPQATEQIWLYIRRIEYIATYLKDNGILPARIGIAESSSYSDLYREYSKKQKETYCGIRIVVTGDFEGYKQFLTSENA